MDIDDKVVDNLAILVKQLAHSLKKHNPDSALPENAMGYLKRHGLDGSPLRDSSSTEDMGA